MLARAFLLLLLLPSCNAEGGWCFEVDTYVGESFCGANKKHCNLMRADIMKRQEQPATACEKVPTVWCYDETEKTGSWFRKCLRTMQHCDKRRTAMLEVAKARASTLSKCTAGGAKGAKGEHEVVDHGKEEPKAPGE